MSEQRATTNPDEQRLTAEELRRGRSALNLSQAGLGRRIGVSGSTIQRAEAGERFLSRPAEIVFRQILAAHVSKTSKTSKTSRASASAHRAEATSPAGSDPAGAFRPGRLVRILSRFWR